MQTITIAIIIGIITTIYKNAKKSKNGETQSRPVSINRGDFQEAYKRLKENSTRTIQPESLLPNEPVLMSVENMEQRPNNSLRNEMNPIVKETQKIEKGNEEFLVNGFAEQKKLVDAVIWSEILGEPRSKKSYFANRKF